MSERPQAFETYPPPAGERPIDDGLAQGAAPTPAVPTPAARAGSTRRTVLKALAGVTAVGAVVAIFSRLDEPYTPETAPTSAVDTSIWVSVGSYGANIPSGWAVNTAGSSQMLATHGKNQVLARVFTTSDAAGPALLERVAQDFGSFNGQRGDVTTYARRGGQKASVSGEGTLLGEPATLKAQLWVTGEGEALLVVSLLTAAEGTQLADEAAAIVASFAMGVA